MIFYLIILYWYSYPTNQYFEIQNIFGKKNIEHRSQQICEEVKHTAALGQRIFIYL